MDYKNKAANTISSTYKVNGKLSRLNCIHFAAQYESIKNSPIDDFSDIISDVKKKLIKLRGKFDLSYEDDDEYLPLNKAIVKGETVLTLYKELYMNDTCDAEKKIYICKEYYEFDKQYNLIDIK